MESGHGAAGATPTQGDRERAPSVLIVAEGGDAGGIGRYCVDLAELMGERAHLVCLCVAPCPDERACWLAAECAKRDIPLSRVQMPAKAWRSGLAGLVAVWKHHGRPIVHVNGRRGNAIAMVARLVVPGFRYVTTVHGVLGLHDRRNVIYRLVDLAAGRFATAVIAVSADTRRRLLKAGTPDSRIVVVPNGLAATELAALRAVAARREPGDAWMDAHGRPLRVGFLGRLSPEKGTRELIEACQHLHGSGASVTVAIAGDGPDLEWMVRASGPMVEDGFLRFVGEVRDVPAFLGDVDVLVMPSHNEGMPYVLLEAMAAGCAVVAFDVGGIGEVIQTDSLGILVPPRDVEGLVTGLRCLVDERSRAAAIGRAASAAMEGEYALDRRLPRLAQAYGVAVEQIRASGHAPSGVRAD